MEVWPFGLAAAFLLVYPAIGVERRAPVAASGGISVDASSMSWYMNEINLSASELSKKAQISVAKLDTILSGSEDKALTFHQLNKVAEVLETTSAALLIPPPTHSDIPDSPDFRRNSNEPLTYSFRRELKRVMNYRQSYLSLAGDNVRKVSILESFTYSSVDAVAAKLRKEIFGDNIGLPYKELSSRIEDTGILVFQLSNVERFEFRGYSAYFDYAPLIVLNSKDAKDGKVFTLAHELAHLMNHSSGLCSEYGSQQSEVLCNRFASRLLMPTALVNRFEKDNVDDWATSVKKKMHVSKLAAMIRLKEMGKANEQDVARAREETENAYRLSRKKQKEHLGGPKSWQTKQSHLGEKYVRTVLGALDSGRIDTLDATYMLNTRVKTVEDLQNHLGYVESVF